jgi:hypothetical protein
MLLLFIRRAVHWQTPHTSLILLHVVIVVVNAVVVLQLHIDTILHHAEEILSEIQEDQWRTFDQLDVDHVVGRKFTDLTIFQ